MRLPATGPWLPLILLALSPGLAWGQQDPTGLADRQWDDGHVDQSYATLSAALLEHPGEYSLLWRAARAATTLGLMHRDIPKERDEWLKRAIRHGDDAAQADSLGVEGLHWRVWAMGELSLRQGPRSALRLGGRVFADATALLERDALDAAAHTALGRVHLEIMALSGWERTLGKLVGGGGALSRANWAEAEAHLSRAVSLEPAVMLYHINLGNLFALRGRGPEAKAEFRRALELRGGHPLDTSLGIEAEVRLANVLMWAPDSIPGAAP